MCAQIELTDYIKYPDLQQAVADKGSKVVMTKTDKLEEKEGSLILLLTPNIWISPPTERENCFDFLRSRRIYRYNNIQNDLLDAWIKLLFGTTGAQEVKVSCFSDTNFPAEFTISTRSVFTSGEVLDAA